VLWIQFFKSFLSSDGIICPVAEAPCGRSFPSLNWTLDTSQLKVLDAKMASKAISVA